MTPTKKKFPIIHPHRFDTYTLREQITSRGGGVEIDLTKLGYPEQKMTAYQNYLGGGMLGSIGNDCTIPNWQNDEKLQDIALQLSKYYHGKANPGTLFEEVQLLPLKAY